MRNLFLITLLSLLLWAIFSGINPGLSTGTSILVFLVSLLFVTLLFISVSRLQESHLARKNSQALLSGLSQLLYFSSIGSSLSKNLKIIARTSFSTKLSAGFNALIRRMRLGEDFSAAMTSTFEKELGELRIRFFPATSGPNPQLSAALFEYDQVQKEKSSASLDALQRSSTVGMFLSTLLPSFILFVFVGSSVLSQGAPSLFLFSLVLLFAIPLLFAISHLSFARRWIAQTT